jgi:hypothetical protein
VIKQDFEHLQETKDLFDHLRKTKDLFDHLRETKDLGESKETRQENRIRSGRDPAVSFRH